MVDLAQGLVELDPANLGYSAAAHLCSGCGNAAAAVAVLRGRVGGVLPVLKGKLGVQKAIAEIEAAGGRVLGTEVTIKTAQGEIRADVIYTDSNGQTIIGEAKNGPFADYNSNQINHGYPGGGPVSGVVTGVKGGNNLPAGTPIQSAPVRTFKY